MDDDSLVGPAAHQKTKLTCVSAGSFFIQSRACVCTCAFAPSLAVETLEIGRGGARVGQGGADLEVWELSEWAWGSAAMQTRAHQINLATDSVKAADAGNVGMQGAAVYVPEKVALI